MALFLQMTPGPVALITSVAGSTLPSPAEDGSIVDSLRPHGLQCSRLPFLLLSLGICSNSCPLSQ